MLKRHLYLQVLVAIFLGILTGALFPSWAVNLKPLAFLFVKAIKMIIAPIIFLSLVTAVTHVRSLSQMGKIGGTALCYFISMTFIALLIGLLVANTLQPGHGLDISLADFDMEDVKAYTGKQTAVTSLSMFISNFIPDTFVSAFVDGEILQVLVVAILFSIALLRVENNIEPALVMLNTLAEIFFNIIGIIVKFAPIGAFAAMGFTVGAYGLKSLLPLLYLLICFYITCAVFILVGLGLVLRLYCKVSVIDLIRYIKEELAIVLGTSSSESVLPLLIKRLEHLGCERSVVSLVLPLGYSFNLDGTCIYLTLAALFIAQVLQVDLTAAQQLSLLLLMLVTSKGAAGITGSGFIVLASTLSMLGNIPPESIVIILGVDRFMSEGRAITNMIGNCIAILVISKWQNKLDHDQLFHVLKHEI